MDKSTIKVTMQFVGDKILPHVGSIMRMPLAGDVAYPLGRNLQFALQVENKFYRMRAELAKEFVELDEKGNLTFAEPNEQGDREYIFDGEEKKAKYMEAVDELFKRFPFEMKVYRFPRKLMAKVPQFAPMAMIDLEAIFEPEPDEVKAPTMEVVKDVPETLNEETDATEPAGFIQADEEVIAE